MIVRAKAAREKKRKQQKLDYEREREKELSNSQPWSERERERERERGGERESEGPWFCPSSCISTFSLSLSLSHATVGVFKKIRSCIPLSAGKQEAIVV